jgi:hypothetical protein
MIQRSTGYAGIVTRPCSEPKRSMNGISTIPINEEPNMGRRKKSQTDGYPVDLVCREIIDIEPLEMRNDRVILSAVMTTDQMRRNMDRLQGAIDRAEA